MSLKRRKKKLFYESNSLSRLLFEQEDLFGDEESADEETAEEDTGDDAAEDEPAEEEGDEGGEEATEEEPEEDEIEVDLDDEVKLSKSIDQDLEALFIDFETDARKSKEIESQAEESEVVESLRLGMLLEQETYEQKIDLERFTSEIARLVKNYTSLLDMEKMLVSKAREFVATRYGEEAETDLVSILDTQHDIAIEEPESSEDVPKDKAPIAVGAGTGAAGGSAA